MLQAKNVIVSLHNPFLRTGLQLVVDGVPVGDRPNLLQLRITRFKARKHTEAKVYSVMG